MSDGAEKVTERTTARLLLRGWTDADRAAFAAMNADPEVMRHFPQALDRAASDAMLDRFVAGWAQRGLGLWAVERRADGLLLGWAGLNPMPEAAWDRYHSTGMLRQLMERRMFPLTLAGVEAMTRELAR